jgi:hypothetical protein
MGIRLVALGCLLAVLAAPIYAATTELWVWVDSNGVKQFSDRPVPGAKRVSIATMEPAQDVKPAASPAPSPSPTARRPQPQSVQYQLVEIFQPQNEETFFGTDAVVDVRIRTEPDLGSGDRLRLYLDGELIARQGGGTEYSLSGLNRGAHSITVQIVDAEGEPKLLSEPRVFHIRHETVGVPNRAVGPSLRPPSPPRPTPRPGGN